MRHLPTDHDLTEMAHGRAEIPADLPASMRALLAVREVFNPRHLLRRLRNLRQVERIQTPTGPLTAVEARTRHAHRQATGHRAQRRARRGGR